MDYQRVEDQDLEWFIYFQKKIHIGRDSRRPTHLVVVGATPPATGLLVIIILIAVPAPCLPSSPAPSWLAARCPWPVACCCYRRLERGWKRERRRSRVRFWGGLLWEKCEKILLGSGWEFGKKRGKGFEEEIGLLFWVLSERRERLSLSTK